MNILEANQKDLPRILELQKDCYQQEAQIYNDYTIPPLLQTLESITTDFENQTFIKIEIQGKIIGSVRGYFENGTCKIGRLIVDKDFQNQGIGSLLIKNIEAHFNHVNTFELFTGDKSAKNLFLYKKLGYIEFKRKIINTNLELIYLKKEK